MCMCVCVCIYIYIIARGRKHTGGCIGEHGPALRHPPASLAQSLRRFSMSMHTHTPTHTCLHTHRHAHTYAHTHTHTGAVCPDIHTHTCMLARTHTRCLCVRVCISCTFPYYETHAHRHPCTHVHVDIIKTTPAICFCVQAAAQSCYRRCPARRFSFRKTIANQ